MKSATLGFAFVVAVSACAGDHPVYDGVEFDIVSAPPVPVSVESDRIELVVGVAVEVTVTPLSSERKYARDDVVLLRSDDSEYFDVYAGESDSHDFVLVGLRPGTTCLQVKINRHEKDCIDVRVRAAH